METSEIAEKYGMVTEEFNALDATIKEQLKEGGGDLIKALEIMFPSFTPRERAKIFILFHLAKQI